MSRSLRVAIVGAGPAGTYAADILLKAAAKRDFEVDIDLIERLPAPFGLVRYGVAPDHPRIKGIIAALEKVLGSGRVRFMGNTVYGTDLTLADLRRFYDAVVFSTGCIEDAPLDLPGADLPGSYGAAEFVSWFDGHPDYPRTWPLEAPQIAVLGVGNVALDVSRMLAKHVEDLLPTEIPANVHEGLTANPAEDVHVYGRRGPAQAKFTPLELRELGQVPDVDMVVYPEDFEFDAGSMEAVRKSNQVKQVVNTLQGWTLTEPEDMTASRRIHLHFLSRPVAILGDGKVEAIRTERMELTGDGSVRGTGVFQEEPVQAVYRAVGYFGTPLADLPFDAKRGIIPNDAGRVVGSDGAVLSGIYTTGWIKRGPVGLIGSTKSDALETVTRLEEDRSSLMTATEPDPQAVLDFLEAKGVSVTNWSGWERLDAHERSLGEPHGRTRVKVVPREDMVRLSRD